MRQFVGCLVGLLLLPVLFSPGVSAQPERFTLDSVLKTTSSSNNSTGLQFEDSPLINQGKLVTIAQTKLISMLREPARCIGTLYIPATYDTTTTVEETPKASKAWFRSNTLSPAAGLRVNIRNVTAGVDQNPNPYTDREYNQGDRSESFIVKQNTAHRSRYFAVVPGLNTLTYEIKQGNKVVESGTLTVTMTSETRESPFTVSDLQPSFFSDECASQKYPEIKLPELPLMPQLPTISPEVQQFLDQNKK